MTAEDRMEKALRWIMIGAVVFVALMFAVVAAFAHDPEHHELDHWYASVKQPDTGISCCGPSDAYFCDEAARGSQVVCKINDDRDNAELKRLPVANGTMIDIPPHKINKDPNPTGRAVVWLSPSGFVWCFVGISGS
jgi:hypothetical protein